MSEESSGNAHLVEWSHGHTPDSRGRQWHGRSTLRRPARRGRHRTDVCHHGDRRGEPSGLRPRRAVELVQRQVRGGSAPRPSRTADRRPCRLPVRAARRGDRPHDRQGDPRRRLTRRLRRTRDRDRFVPVRPSGRGPRSRGLLRVPHARRPRPDPHLGHRARPNHRPRDRRRSARPRSGQCTEGTRPRRPRRGDGAVPDAAAARRGRGPHARPLGRLARRRSALWCRSRPVPVRCVRQRDRPPDGRRDDLRE